MAMPREKFFKGWAKPGPELDPDRTNRPELEAGQTLDAISGDFRLFQLKDGHRFSTDDILVAWYGTNIAPSVSRVLDLGSGIGTVGMIAAWRLRGASFVTIEAQAESVRLAKKSATFNLLNDRYEIREGDFRDPEVIGEDERFDLILGSPPYFPEDTGILAEHPQKIACRFEVRGDIGDYCKAATPHLSAGGVFAFIFPIQPAHQLERVRGAASAAGLTLLRSRAICLKEGQPPLLSLFAMLKSTDVPSTFKGFEEPALTIRCKDGSIHPEYSAIKLSIGFPP
jgi:tRNA1Val (adenine37-N6)-methyltransferase